MSRPQVVHWCPFVEATPAGVLLGGLFSRATAVRSAVIGIAAEGAASFYAAGENLLAVDLATSVVQRFQVRGQTDLLFAAKMFVPTCGCSGVDQPTEHLTVKVMPAAPTIASLRTSILMN